MYFGHTDMSGDFISLRDSDFEGELDKEFMCMRVDDGNAPHTISIIRCPWCGKILE